MVLKKDLYAMVDWRMLFLENPRPILDVDANILCMRVCVYIFV